MFFRHKLQKGLLTKDQEPKEDEMKHMSEFITKLEGYADLEVSIIRATKINKVLKAILKLNSIPKEEEYNFKTRSQTLLDKWNKLLAVDQDSPVTPAAPVATNGAKLEVPSEGAPAQTEGTNGVKESSTDKGKEDDTPAATAQESKEEEPNPEAVVTPSADEAPKVLMAP